MKTVNDDVIDNSVATTEYVNNAIAKYERYSYNIEPVYPILIPLLLDHYIDSTSWVRSDIYQEFSDSYTLDGAKYAKIYNHLISDKETGTSKTETINDITISFILAVDGHKIVDGTQPQNIFTLNELFKTTGHAWYYVIFEDRHEFILPKSVNYLKCINTNNNVADYEMGNDYIPNISGNFTLNSKLTDYNGQQRYACDISSYNKLFEPDDKYNSALTLSPEGSEKPNTTFIIDASRYNGIYCNESNTINIASVGMFLYFSTGISDKSSNTNISNINACLNNGTKLISHDVDIGKISSNNKFNAYTTQNSCFAIIEMCGVNGIVQVYIKSEIDEYYVGNISNVNSTLCILNAGIVNSGCSILLKSVGDLEFNQDTAYLKIYEYDIKSGTFLKNNIRSVDFSSKQIVVRGSSFAADYIHFEADGFVTIELHGKTTKDFFVKIDNKTIIGGLNCYDTIAVIPVSKDSDLSWSDNENTELYMTLITYGAKICHLPKSTENIIGRKNGTIPVLNAMSGEIYYKGQYIKYSNNNNIYNVLKNFTSTGLYNKDISNLKIFSGNLPEYSYAIYEHDTINSDGTLVKYLTAKQFVRQKFSKTTEYPQPGSEENLNPLNITIPYPIQFADDVYCLKGFSTRTPPSNVKANQSEYLNQTVSSSKTCATISLMPKSDSNDYTYKLVSKNNFYVYVMAEGKIS